MKDSTAASRRAQQARLRDERGFHTSAATATGDLVQKPVQPLTGAAYDRMLQEWDLFTSEQEGDASPLDVATLKKFLKWYCDGRKGRLAAVALDTDGHQRITQNSAYTCWKSFMSAWHRRTGDTFSKSIQSTMETLIYGGDDNWLNLRTARRPTRNFTLMDFQACVRQLWQNDWYDFRCEMYRVCLHLMMLMHIGTSARSAEYVINLRYRDTSLYQVWFEDCPQPQLVIDLCRNHTKGLANLPRQQPEHLLYELVDLPFYYNTIAFFVAGLLAVNGLRDFDSWSSVCAVTKPPDRNFVLLDYADNVLDRHVFARYSDRRGCETKAATSLINALGDLGQRTGFLDKPTPGAIRREALLQVDRHGYSINERMRHADHRNANTYGGYYQNAISTVDGQATYFGLERQLPALHELFRGFSIRRDYQFRPELPWKLHRQAVDPGSATEGEHDVDDEALDRRARQKAYDERRQRRCRLRRAHQQQLGSKPTPTSVHGSYDSDFQQARRLMPERDRLAEALFHTGSLRSTEGAALMNDLVTLYSSRNSDTYCAELNCSPSNCDSCGVARRESSSHSWWSHVYHCHKQRQENLGRFAEFCFLCFAWIDDVEVWNEHAETHRQDLPLKCSFAMFRGTVLRPGWCLDCVCGSPTRGVASKKKLTQFLNVTSWRAHTDQHIRALRPGPYKCSHPRCTEAASYPSLSEYVTHRFDIHLIPPPNNLVNDKELGRCGIAKKAARDLILATEDEDTAEDVGSTDGAGVVPGASDDPPCTDPRSCWGWTMRHAEALPVKQVAESCAIGLETDDSSLTVAQHVNENHSQSSYDESAAVEALPLSPAMSCDAGHSQLRKRHLPRSGEGISVISSSSSTRASELGRPIEGSACPKPDVNQGSPFRSVQTRSTNIEVVIPTKPKVWDNVPLVTRTGHDRETAGQNCGRQDATFKRTVNWPNKCLALQGRCLDPSIERGMAPRSQSVSQLSPGWRMPHGHVGSRPCSSATQSLEPSEIQMRRRNAIVAMHARIKERRRSRAVVVPTTRVETAVY